MTIGKSNAVCVKVTLSEKHLMKNIAIIAKKLEVKNKSQG
jgi:hypothetical protein